MKDKLIEQQLKILEWVVCQIESFGRSLEGYDDESLMNRCLYNSANGRHCAAGLCVLNPEVLIENSRFGSVYNPHNTLDNKSLKPRFEGLTDDLISALQDLHDTDEYWSTDKELNASGEDRLMGIIGNIQRGCYLVQ